MVLSFAKNKKKKNSRKIWEFAIITRQGNKIFTVGVSRDSRKIHVSIKGMTKLKIGKRKKK